jgi:hypothetical protein
MHDYIMIYVRPTAACLLPCHGLTLPSFRLLLYLSMPADMAAISFGPNIIIGSFALIAIQLVQKPTHNREQSRLGVSL